MKALDDLCIIDLTRYLPGSFTSMFLADFGAEVIMIESPTRGEPGRSNPPFINGVSARHLLLQRNKKSLTLDLNTSEGKEIFFKLIESADVVIENFKPGYLSKIGLDYDAAVEVNPRIIYCSLTGFGQYGPNRDIAGHDINYIGLAGILGLSGSAQNAPCLPGIQIADLCGSLMAQIGILVALMSRNKTGRGQYIDISFLDSAISLLPLIAAAYFAENRSYKQGEHIYTGSMAWYNIYLTKDHKYLTIGALETKFWHKLCEYLDVPEFKDMQFEQEQQPKMIAKLQEIFMTKTQQEWIQLLAPLNVCVGPVLEVSEVFNDPNTIEREMVFTANHPVAGEVKQIGFPIKMSYTPAAYQRGAPLLGEDNRNILISLGYSLDDIEELRKKNII